MLGALTILDDQASVGPLKLTRVALVGDAAYPTGGTPGFLAALNDLVDERRSVIAVMPTGVNGGLLPEYTQVGAKALVTVTTAGLFTTRSPVDPRTGLGGSPVAHGYSAGDPVYLELQNPGTGSATDPHLPGGFVEKTLYYVIASGLTANDFKLSATSGGSAIVPTNVGVGLFKVYKSDKLLVRVSSTGAEESNATDLSGSTHNLLVLST